MAEKKQKKTEPKVTKKTEKKTTPKVVKATTKPKAVSKKAVPTTSKKTKSNFKNHDKDTGSVQVQIGSLGGEIVLLQAHIVINKKDFDAKRSLLKKVAKRRTLMRYLKKNDLESYMQISKKIGLKV